MAFSFRDDFAAEKAAFLAVCEQEDSIAAITKSPSQAAKII